MRGTCVNKTCCTVCMLVSLLLHSLIEIGGMDFLKLKTLAFV